MKKLLRKWLGIDSISTMVEANSCYIELLNNGVLVLERDFNSRETCKICGRHRYNSSQCLNRVADCEAA